jgi:catechol 2,3-dioxygenase-like lactoylglutathione lyase family enzyme
MYALEGTSGRETITLRVTDPLRSRGFYQDLFGLAPGRAEAEGPDQVLTIPDGAGDGLSLKLVPGERGHQPDVWLSVEVQSVTEVLDLYLLAIMIGAHATLPRKRAERWNTVVTDPDGNRISIWTTVPKDTGARPHRSPRWEWERAQRPGYDAGAGRAQPEEMRPRQDEPHRTRPGSCEPRPHFHQGPADAAASRRRHDSRGALARDAGDEGV